MNEEDSEMIMKVMVKPLIVKRIREWQESTRKISLQELFEQYDRKKLLENEAKKGDKT